MITTIGSGSFVLDIEDPAGTDHFEVKIQGTSAMVIDNNPTVRAYEFNAAQGNFAQIVATDSIEATVTLIADGNFALGTNGVVTTNYYALTGVTTGGDLYPLRIQNGTNYSVQSYGCGFKAFVVGYVRGAGIDSITLASGGKDYTGGDVLSFEQDDGYGFLATVDPVDETGGNAVTGVTITACGNLYVRLASGYASGGTGTNCIITPATLLQLPGEGGLYEVNGFIGRDNGGTMTTTSFTTTAIFESDDKWNVSASAYNNTNLIITASGINGVTILWGGTLQAMELNVP